MQITNNFINSPYFGTTGHSYLRQTKDKKEKPAICYTNLFRLDMNWDYFASFLNRHFRNSDKVQILNHACSDGSEPYTIAMTLEKKLDKKADKFFPIKAFDYCGELIEEAKKGRINITYDPDELCFDEYGIDKSKYFTPESPNNHSSQLKPHRVNENLKTKVEFRQGDILESLSDMENNTKNTVLMCRNVVPYLSSKERRELLALISEKMGKDSVVVFGAYDMQNFGSFIHPCMMIGGFKKADMFYDSPVYVKREDS